MNCGEHLRINNKKARERRREESRKVIASFLSYLTSNGFRVVDTQGRELQDRSSFVDGFVHKG